ncbi:melanocortin-2 receptor accessory protein [Calypte anna]|uniref:melanocortin-2 receptor accessory protein n=1 Tax=Calypte anna TaxID=9244 RepID=UPI0011C3D5E2|nr:melanocortin-2 receptor accessory protein [Calypte anna]
MANRTNSSEYFWSYEYYWDYIDPIPVDGSKLEVNKYSIVIAFWVGLAAFVTFLFLILLYMSHPRSTPVKVKFRKLLGRRLREEEAGGTWESSNIIHSSHFCCQSYSICRQETVRNQIEESSSNGEEPH